MKPDFLDGMTPQECSSKKYYCDLEYIPDFIIRFRIEPYSDVLVKRIMGKLTYVLTVFGCSFSCSCSGNSFMCGERPYTEKELCRLTCCISNALRVKCYKESFLLASICRIVGEKLDVIYEDYATTEAPLKVWKLADAMRMLGEVKYGRIEIENINQKQKSHNLLLI